MRSCLLWLSKPRSALLPLDGLSLAPALSVPRGDLGPCASPLTRISTSHIERANLTVRMHLRRFMRLTNGFSKKLENLKAAVWVFMAWYNFCRVHQTLCVTPAMKRD